MAERSTARPADGAAQVHDDPSEIDSWIAHLARPAADDSDTYDEWSEAAAPQWREDASDPYEESYQPADTTPEEGRHARHRADQQHEEYEQYDGAYGQHEYAAQGSDPVADSAPAGYEPDQTYRSDEHEQASWEERQAQTPYGPIDAGPVHEDAYAALQDTYVPEVGYAAREGHYPHGDDAGGNEYRYGGSAAQEPEAVDDSPTQVLHIPEIDARPRPVSRRRWLIAVGGLALGVLVCALALTWGSGQPEGAPPLVIATIPPEASEEPVALPEIPSATPPSSSATPGTTRSVTRSTTPGTTRSVTRSTAPSAAPSVTRSAAQTRSASPALLGPSGNNGVANMVQGYCDRHAAGSSAEPRNDGSWQCTRLLVVSAVDMDVACRDTYGSGAYARTSNSGDPYAWRCYR